jgi:hypothetical protein
MAGVESAQLSLPGRSASRRILYSASDRDSLQA